MNVSILVIISFILTSFKNDRKKDDPHRFVHGIYLQRSKIQILTVVTGKTNVRIIALSETAEILTLLT